jgi:hypothetical protein
MIPFVESGMEPRATPPATKAATAVMEKRPRRLILIFISLSYVSLLRRRRTRLSCGFALLPSS